MNPPLRALLYGTGLLFAFAAGWLLKPTAHPETGALARAAHRSQPPGVRTPSKSAHPLAASGESWLDAASADLTAVRAAMQPGVVNQVLLDKLQEVLNIPDKFQRAATWQGLMNEMRPEDALAVRDIFSGLNEEGRRSAQEFQSFLHQWGRIDGATAAPTLGEALFEDGKLLGVMVGWGERDPHAALTWLKSQHAEFSGCNLVLSGVLEGMAATDPGAAETMLMENANNPEFKNILGRLAGIRVEQGGLAAALNWFSQLAATPGPDSFKEASLTTLMQLAEKSGILTGGTPIPLAAYDREPWFPENAAQALGKAWAEKDPIAGVAEIQKMTSPEAKKTAVRNLSVWWAAGSPESLSIWLTENGGHPMFDEAAYELTRTLHPTDPEAGRAWGAQIKDPALKSKAAGFASPTTAPSTGE